MSYSIDVNVLLYASDRSSRRYEAARRFLDQCANGPDLLCLAWPTLTSYLRTATHRSIFAAPLSPEEAFQNIEALLSMPHVRAASELEGFAEAYRHVTKGLVVRGNLVPDAHLAAILFQHGVRTLYSGDGDFKKFPSLHVQDPFSVQ
jgi:uncharacterized protein